MVRAFHAAGIEVVLDVVFNHTAEGNREGADLQLPRARQPPLLPARRARPLPQLHRLRQHGQQQPSGRPLPDPVLPAATWSPRPTSTGSGSTWPRSWAANRRGEVMVEPPVIEIDLRRCAAGRHQDDRRALGRRRGVPGRELPGRRSAGRSGTGSYRDDVRRFWRGDPGMTSALATRLCGSDDLYHGRGPLYSINFITCHDGFTLLDLVSYNTQAQRAQRRGQPRRHGRQL